MGDDLLRHRSQDELSDTVETRTTQHDHLRTLGGLEERRRRGSWIQRPGDGEVWCSRLQGGNGVVHHLLRRSAQALVIEVHRRRTEADRRKGNGPAMDHLERQVTACCDIKSPLCGREGLL